MTLSVASTFLRRPVTSASSSALHRDLVRWNRMRFASGNDDGSEVMEHGQDAFVAAELREVASQTEEAPRSGEAFAVWFDRLKGVGPGQHDPLLPWLAYWAPPSAVLWFLKEQVVAEAAFADLAAIPDVRLAPLLVNDTARSYRELAEALDLEVAVDEATWEAQALANLTAAFATDRRWAWHAVGALAAVKLTAHGQAAYVCEALERIGVTDVPRSFALLATPNRRRPTTWTREYLDSVFTEAPNGERAHAIAEGALMRLTAQARCYSRYRRELGIHPRG